MEMKAAVRRFGHIARQLLAPIALCVTLAMGAPSHAAEKIGIVFMHGEAGAPGRVIVSLTDALEKAGYLVSRPDMCWSARRSYEASFSECLSTVDDSIVRLKNLGATEIVVGGFGLGGAAAIAYGAGHPGLLGIIAIAPGHDAGTVAARPDIADSIARARGLVAAGKGDDEGDFADVNIGPTGLFSAEIATTPTIYLSFFGPNSQTSIGSNVGKVSAPLLWVMASDESGEDAGQSGIFARAPANPLNRFVTVAGGRLGAPEAAKADVLAWLKTLDAK
jgi:pimeloyl-ACP methyl ester carboxylesterase